MNENILLCGNPNVGKSSLFNILTHSHEHTGNWTGKTVELASKKIKKTHYTLVDLPGIYSLSDLSDEEKITKNTLLFDDYEKIIYVCDASSIEKNLNLLLQILQINRNVILCINMIDEVEEKGIKIDYKKLESILNIKIIKCSTKNKIGINELINSLSEDTYSNYSFYYSECLEEKISKVESLLPKYFNNRFIAIKVLENDTSLVDYIYERYGINIIDEELSYYLRSINSEEVSNEISIKLNSISSSISKETINVKDKEMSKLDKVFSNKLYCILSLCLIMFGIFLITIVLANYPSDLLSKLFSWIEGILYNLCKDSIPKFIYEPLLFGIYRIVTYIISVMFPPLVIFFFLFTYAEETGILPRIAFNLDGICKCCNCHGKQSLTMCSGFGCNACAIVGSRIIDSKRDRLLAIITNSFIPCNGRFPMIIALISMFFTNSNNKLLVSFYLMLFVLFSIIISFLTSFILSKTLLKGYSGFFILELPDYKKVKLSRILKNSFVYKSLSILKKAILVSIPSGLIIWLMTNIKVNNVSVFSGVSTILEPFGRLLGMDGNIILSFLLGLPANEIVLPIMIMGYLNTSSISLLTESVNIKNIFINNGWTFITAINVILFSIMHFPCGTTLLTIKKEVGTKWMIYSFLVPLLLGIIFLTILNLLI